MSLNDPDCDCGPCRNALLTPDDLEWLEAHGWRRPPLPVPCERLVQSLIGPADS